jgi:hypothetical protein
VIAQDVRVPSMTLPHAVELPADRGKGLAGFWVEVRDSKGEVLYRIGLPDPFEGGMELFDEGGGMRRVDAAAHEAAVEVLIPDLPAAAGLHVFSSNPSGDREKRGRPAGQVAVIDLTPKQERGHGGR